MRPHRTPCFVIVVHHGSAASTRQLVASLVSNSTVPDQIVVVDHNHPAPPLRLSPSSPSSSGPVQVIRPAQNDGYGAGLLVGLGALLQQADNPSRSLVLCLNNDATVAPDTVTHLQAWWQQRSEPTLAAARLGRVNLLTGRARLTPSPFFFSLPYLHGSALVGSITNLARYLPADYFLYSEDVALSWRARHQQLSLVQLPPEIAIRHDDGNHPPDDHKLYYLVRNGARVLEQEAPPAWRSYWKTVNSIRRLYHHLRRHRLLTRALRDARRPPPAKNQS